MNAFEYRGRTAAHTYTYIQNPCVSRHIISRSFYCYFVSIQCRVVMVMVPIEEQLRLWCEGDNPNVLTAIYISNRHIFVCAKVIFGPELGCQFQCSNIYIVEIVVDRLQIN